MEGAKERLGIHIPYIFPIQWGAGSSYLEFPNHLIVDAFMLYGDIVIKYCLRRFSYDLLVLLLGW